MAQVNLDDTLAAGRQAARQYAWLEAFQLLGVADQAGRLDADDLETFAETAWWNGRPDQCISARERAYALHLQSGRPRRAALIGIALAKGEFERGAPAIGAAWLSRAERLLCDAGMKLPERAEMPFAPVRKVTHGPWGEEGPRVGRFIPPPVGEDRAF